MGVTSRNIVCGAAESRLAASPEHDRNALIVEPDRLLRWSLVTYLSRWFQVFPVESLAEAGAVLTTHRIDAVVISDEVARRDARELERRAVGLNPTATVVSIVTSAGEVASTPNGAASIEKPFELAALARLLGVRST